MEWPVSRRRVIRRAGFGAVVGLAGCQAGPKSQPSASEAATVDTTSRPTETGTERSLPREPIQGRITAVDGVPIPDAVVELVAPPSTRLDVTETDASGRFSLDAGSAPGWLRVRHPAFAPRVRAVTPGGQYRLQLTPADGGVTLTFGGDTMFGRRYYQNGDRSPHFQFDDDQLLASHRALVGHLAPVFRTADVASVNLETPLTTSAWRHPHKAYTFQSHPVAATALGDAGVDYAALANNHAFDALAPGLRDTIDALTEAGLAVSGAGQSLAAAWEPALVDRNGVRVALLSCTTEAGEHFGIDWAAERGTAETHTVTSADGDDLRFSGTVGVAAATDRHVAASVARARDKADVVVVQIHGGEQYRRTPTSRIQHLVDVASTAGADIVANHHPHVTGGVEFRRGTLVAWSLGNLFFDQELWATARSYLLTVHVSREGIRRASIEPLLLDGYVPTGVTGAGRRRIVHEMAGYTSTDFAVTGDDLAFLHDRKQTPTRTTRRLTGADDIFIREAGWIDAIERHQGSVRIGIDRLVTGALVDSDVDTKRGERPLWRVDPAGQATSAPNAGPGDLDGGMSLTRTEADHDPAVMGPRYRIPIRNPSLTAAVLYRTSGATGPDLRMTWYDGLEVARGRPAGREPMATAVSTLPGTAGEWHWTTVGRQAPEGARYVDVDLALSPPEQGTPRELSVADMKLVEWTTAGARRRAYDALYLDGTATIRFGVAAGADRATDVTWRRLGA